MAQLILHFVYGQCLPDWVSTKLAVECIKVVDNMPGTDLIKLYNCIIYDLVQWAGDIFTAVYFGCNPPFTRTVVLLIFVMSDWFCQAVRPILPGWGNFLVHRFIESFIWNLWLTIGHELHKIRWRDRKIPISKISQRAWQNQTDSKNQTDFGCSCKQGVRIWRDYEPEVTSPYF
jgi:hypothetical protein